MNGLNKTEIKRDELNLQLRELITIIDFIDGNKKDYKNYVLIIFFLILLLHPLNILVNEV